MRPLAAALSIFLEAVAKARTAWSLLPSAAKVSTALIAERIADLRCTLATRRFSAVLTRLIADLMLAMDDSPPIKLIRDLYSHICSYRSTEQTQL
jgi:hypothetical protein